MKIWRILHGRLGIPIFSSSAESISHERAKRYFQHSKIKIRIPKRPCNVLFILQILMKFLHKRQLLFFFVNEISKEPAARLSGKLSRNWLIMLVTMATPISSHVKDKNGILTARDEEMIFQLKEKYRYFISIYIIQYSISLDRATIA